MAASIAWTDSTGAASLTNGLSRCRFNDWRPRPATTKQARYLMATNARRTWEYSERQIVAFYLDELPNTLQALMTRLCLHLDRGGSATLNTGDTAARVYTDMQLAPDADLPWPVLHDRASLLYRMDFTLVHASGTPTPLLCLY